MWDGGSGMTKKRWRQNIVDVRHMGCWLNKNNETRFDSEPPDFFYGYQTEHDIREPL